MKSSPLDDKAAIIESQLVILSMLATRVACGGRYGAISDGNAYVGKLWVHGQYQSIA